MLRGPRLPQQPPATAPTRRCTRRSPTCRSSLPCRNQPHAPQRPPPQRGGRGAHRRSIGGHEDTHRSVPSTRRSPLATSAGPPQGPPQRRPPRPTAAALPTTAPARHDATVATASRAVEEFDRESAAAAGAVRTAPSAAALRRSATPIQCGRGVLGQRPAVTNKLWQRPEQPPEELSKNCRHHAAQRSSELRVTSADSRSGEPNFRWTLPKLGFLHYSEFHPKDQYNRPCASPPPPLHPTPCCDTNPPTTGHGIQFTI